jgi:predicted glutamine amidotransferase
MIAKASVEAVKVADEMLNCPHSLKYLSQQGKQPLNPELRGAHNDGCGIAFVNGSGLTIEKRGKENSWDASYIDLVNKAQSKIFIAHNRLASAFLKGNMDSAKSHPYKKDGFAFCHNGGIEGFKEEANALQVTDSAIFLDKIISEDEPNITQTIRERIEEVAETTPYTSMCGLLMNHEDLYVWRLYNDKHAENDVQRYEEYYTLYILRRGENEVVISSEPLTDEPWEKIPNKTFLEITPCKEKVNINIHHLDV